MVCIRRTNEDLAGTEATVLASRIHRGKLPIGLCRDWAGTESGWRTNPENR